MLAGFPPIRGVYTEHSPRLYYEFQHRHQDNHEQDEEAGTICESESEIELGATIVTNTADDSTDDSDPLSLLITKDEAGEGAATDDAATRICSTSVLKDPHKFFGWLPCTGKGCLLLSVMALIFLLVALKVIVVPLCTNTQLCRCFIEASDIDAPRVE